MTEPMLSRVADNMYWMSRYLERAEHTIRLLKVHLDMKLDYAPSGEEDRWNLIARSLLTPTPDPINDDTMTQLLICEPDNGNSVVSCIAAARENARHVRELVSSEMWEYLNTLYLDVRDTSLDKVFRDEPFVYLRDVENRLLLIQGVTDSTMNHGEGWHFIHAGRFIERALSIGQLLDVYSPVLLGPLQDVTAQRYAEWVGVLKSCTAFEAYVKIYSADIHPRYVVDFLTLNDEFPHAIGFSIGRLEAALLQITEITERRKNIRVNRLAGRLRAMLGFTTIDEIMETGLSLFLHDLRQQCDEIHAALQETYVNYPIETMLDT